MREILFKAKRKDNGEWVEGYYAEGIWYIDEKKKYAILPLDICFYPRRETSEWFEVDPKTVCQYTGLTDKNGNKIWENDIVHIPYQNLEDSICKVIYRRGMFISELADDCEDSIIRNDIEAIGNVFDNPELLNQ